MLRRHCTPAIAAFSSMLLCLYVGPAFAPSQAVFFSFFLAAGAAGIVLFHASRPDARYAGVLLLALGLGCLLGLWSVQRMADEARSAFLPVSLGQVSRFSGSLSQDSTLSSKGDTILRVELDRAGSETTGVSGRARGKALVFLRGSYGFSLGERISVRSGLVPWSGEGGENFTAWVERGDLERQGYASPVWAGRAEGRGWLHRAVSRAGYPASALMEALLIGSREDVPADLYQNFRKTGSLHILALSGLHVSVLYGFLIAVLGFLRSRGMKLVIATLALLFYQFLAGFMPSLLRATVMICLAGACLLLDRDHEPLNLLALSGAAILIADPFQASSLSFQLSYLALAGILALGPPVQRALEGRLPKVVLTPLAMSLGAQIATFPIVIARFGTWYPSGLLASLILVPLTTALLWAGLGWLVLFLVPWPPLHDLGARAIGFLYASIDSSARVMGRLPGVSIDPRLLVPAVCVSAAAMLGLALFVPRVRRPVLRAAS